MFYQRKINSKRKEIERNEKNFFWIGSLRHRNLFDKCQQLDPSGWTRHIWQVVCLVSIFLTIASHFDLIVILGACQCAMSWYLIDVAARYLRSNKAYLRLLTYSNVERHRFLMHLADPSRRVWNRDYRVAILDNN